MVVAGRYRVLARLGQGGMGVTYRAWDEQSGRPVVLKHPKQEMLTSPGFIERFGREARMMAAFSHPNVVPITTVGEHDGIPYLVMPFLPGGSLSNRRLRDDSGEPQPMHPSTLHLWLPQVAAALDYVHSQGVVHRDVKPGNVFFDGFWHAYLGDFGISKIVEETASLDKEHTLTGTSVAVGTQGYMAPELFAPKPVIDGRTDQYALGVMVYEMLAGRRPFTGDTAHLIVEVTTKNVPPLRGFRRDLPRSLEEAVYQALAKHSGDRFESCQEFIGHALADVPSMQDEPDVARLLCPACENLLKLPTTAAGKKGRCPRCKNQMEVAADLSAFWLTSEQAAAKTGSGAGSSSEPSSDSGSGPQSWEALTPSSVTGNILRQNPLSRALAGTLPAVWWAALAATAVAVFVAEAALIYDWSTSNLKREITAVQEELRRSQTKVAELETLIAALQANHDKTPDNREQDTHIDEAGRTPPPQKRAMNSSVKRFATGDSINLSIRLPYPVVIANPDEMTLAFDLVGPEGRSHRTARIDVERSGGAEPTDRLSFSYVVAAEDCAFGVVMKATHYGTGLRRASDNSITTPVLNEGFVFACINAGCDLYGDATE